MTQLGVDLPVLAVIVEMENPPQDDSTGVVDLPV